MKITRRDLFVAMATVIVMTVLVSITGITPHIQSNASQMLANASQIRVDEEQLISAAYDWNDIEVQETSTGARRAFFNGSTRTLDRLRYHVTTLNPGETSHPMHSHANEELLIVKEGIVEAYASGQWHKVGPGSVIFQASNDPHSIRNAGTTAATYHVITWYSPGMLSKSD